MILGQISWADCFAFLLFLAPQLIIHVGLLTTAICGIKALPFLGTLKAIALTGPDLTDCNRSFSNASTAHK